MPQKVFNQMIEKNNKPLNMLLSNMAGPMKAPWVFKGKKADWVSIAAVTPTMGPSVTISTIYETTKITVTADKGEFSETRQLVDRIVYELKQADE